MESLHDLKALWKIQRKNPRDVDIANVFNRMCTPYQVHLLLEDQESIKKDYVEVLQDLCTAYRMLVGLDGAFDTPLTNAETLLKKLGDY